ncbi:hypothetical protein quinque_006402 [Culex quinquefasciatus]
MLSSNLRAGHSHLPVARSKQNNSLLDRFVVPWLRRYPALLCIQPCPAEFPRRSTLTERPWFRICEEPIA